MKKVIFHVNYNGCEVVGGNGSQESEMEAMIVEKCEELYDDGDFIGDEFTVKKFINSIAGECEIMMDYVGS